MLDGRSYLKIAKSLWAGHGFGSLEMNRIWVSAQSPLTAAFKALFDGAYTLVWIGFAALGPATCPPAYLRETCCSKCAAVYRQA